MLRRVPDDEACGGVTPAYRKALRGAGMGFSPWGSTFGGIANPITLVYNFIVNLMRHPSSVTAGLFTPLESPAIHGGDNIIKTSTPHRKGGFKATSFLTGFTNDIDFSHAWKKLSIPEKRSCGGN